MKMHFYLPVVLVVSSQLTASTITVRNLNDSDTAGFGLFDSSGSLVDDANTSNMRIGYFEAGFDASAAWVNGDLAALDSNFNTFDSSFGMFAGFDGLFQVGLEDTVADFTGKLITFWAMNADGSFTDTDAEHLIYTFSPLAFPDNITGDSTVRLGTDAGDFLGSGVTASGGFGNFSNDFGFTGGSASGFNTVSVVPEPSAYAALAGCLALGWVMVRRRRA